MRYLSITYILAIISVACAVVVACADPTPTINGQAGTLGRNGNDGVGIQGEGGIQGPQGQPGTSGLDNHIISEWKCSQSETSLLTLSYNAAQSSAGDMFVQGRVDYDGSSAQSSNVWADHDPNAVQGYTTLIFDIDTPVLDGGVAGVSNGGYFEFFLNMQDESVFINYTDKDVVGGKESWTIGCTQSSY